MNQPADLTQARAIPMSDDEKDRQIEEALAMLERQSAHPPAWGMTAAQFHKAYSDRPTRRRSHTDAPH